MHYFKQAGGTGLLYGISLQSSLLGSLDVDFNPKPNPTSLNTVTLIRNMEITAKLQAEEGCSLCWKLYGT